MQPSGPTTVNATAGPNPGATGQEQAATVPATTPAQTTAQQTDATNAQNASSTMTQTLDSLGLGGMATWATNLAYQLAGQGIDPSTIVSTITGQMNNPTNSDGSVNQGALDAFNAALPGFNQLIANTGSNGSPGSSPTQAIANYINYSTQVQQFSQQAGLLPGTITATEIGSLWSGQVSTAEVSQRITDATVTATSAPKQVQDYLANNYGMTPQALTSYYLNPTNTLQSIQTNMNSGMVGGEAAITGFDKNLSTAQASALGAFLANGSSAGGASQIGGVNSVSAANANSFFTSSLGSNQAGGQLGSLAQMAGYTQASTGQAGGAVSEDTLLAAAEGNATALSTTAQAQQARTAGSKGGGGAAATANGAVGLGFSQS